MSEWLADGWWARARRVDSPNFGPRPPSAEVVLAVIHNISLPPGEFGGQWVEDFFLNRLDVSAHPYFSEIEGLQVSSHFFIRRDGEVIQFVSTQNRAWHAGTSSWQGRENCNDYSVGVELEGCDDEPFEAAQYLALWSLIEALSVAPGVKALAGHSDIAPGRKTDPGECFDWSAVRARFPKLDLPEKGL